MDEIKLWRIDSEQDLSPLEGVSQLETEWQLEETLVAHPELLEQDLELIGRQTPAAGGWLDLLGVDSSGRLVVLELKRGSLGRDAISQVLDYASFLTEMDTEDLAEHVKDRSGNGGIQQIDDFATWYGGRFSDLEDLFPCRMILVGLGVDDIALRVARFLSAGSRQVEVITFHGFRRDDEILLARQLPVQRDPVPLRRSGTLPKAERQRQLDHYLEEIGLSERFEIVRSTIRECLATSVYENPLKSGVSLQMDVKNTSGTRGPRSFFGIYAAYTQNDVIEISLNSVTKLHNPREYEALGNAVSLVEWRHGGDAIVVESDAEWERIRPHLVEFAEAVHSSWIQYRNVPMSHTLDEQEER